MSRTPDETPRCACCQSLELTDITHFDPSEGYALVHFELKQPPKGIFQSNRVSLTVNRARVCLACGHVMHFLGAKARTELQHGLAQLAAIPES